MPLHKKRIHFRLFFTEVIVFGEDAHAYLIEFRRRQGSQRLLLYTLRHVYPGISGGTQRIIGLPVSILKIMQILYLYRTGILYRRSALQRARLTGKNRNVTYRPIHPCPRNGRHKANYITSVSIIKTAYPQRIRRSGLPEVNF